MAASRKVEKTEKTEKKEISYKVSCPCCGGVFFETTDKFDASKTANPTMIRLCSPYSDYGWTEPIPDESAGFGSLICPECESMLAIDGRLKLL